MGEIYSLEIGFKENRHCSNCPIRHEEYDICKLQKIGDDYLEFDTWESQMLGCPLNFEREVN